MMDDLSLEHPDLEEYFDAGPGIMPAAVREHLARCRSCAEGLAELAELRNLARQLPQELRPPRELWTGISARIAGQSSPRPPTVTGSRTGARPVRRAMWPSLAAAAVVLIVVSSGVTAFLLRGAAGGAASPVATSQEYRYTVETLEAELAARRSTLSPVTIQTVEQNLAIIDEAIAEARRALAADPMSADLPLLLSGVYRQKVELLRQAVDLAARS